MKKIISVATLFVLLLWVQTGYAQGKNENSPEKFRIKLVQKENGKEKIIDRTFATREEMAAFVRKNQLDLPTLPETPAEGQGNKKITERRKVVINQSKK